MHNVWISGLCISCGHVVSECIYSVYTDII